MYFSALESKEVLRKKFLSVLSDKYPTLVVLLCAAVIPVFCHR